MTAMSVTVLLCLAGLAFAFMIFGGSRRSSGVSASSSGTPLARAWKSFGGQLPYEPKPLLSAWERRALLSIRAQVPTGFYICPQVRLADMLHINAQDALSGKVALSKVASKSVDFAIVELATGNVVLVVELDDKTHDRPDRRERDVFVNAVLDRSGIPIRRFRPSTAIQIRDFFEGNRTQARA